MNVARLTNAYKMKAKACKILDINNPERELWGVWIKRGKGEPSLPLAENGSLYETTEKKEAQAKARAFNAKN